MDQEVLLNPTTLRIFLHVRSFDGAEIGIRETQRALGLKSPSTAAWHLDKIHEAGYLEKLPTKRYLLTEKGKSLENFKIPLSVSVRLVQGMIVPKFAFFIAFIVFDIIFSTILWILVDDPIILGINGLISLIMVLGLLLWQWNVFRKQLNQFIRQ